MNISLAPINKSSGTPITQQIVNLVLANVRAGVLAPGSRLPTERTLAAQLGVARGTVKAAYNALAGMGLVHTRQGSGSYIAGSVGQQLAVRHQHQARQIMAEAASAVSTLGLQPADAAALLAELMPPKPAETLQLALVADAPEILSDIREQLAPFEKLRVSIFILDSITQNAGAEEMLAGFQLILVPNGLLGPVAAALPGLAGRLVPVVLAPSTETLVGVTALPRTSRVGIICRSNVFLSNVKGTLLTYGFSEQHIQSFFEMDYTTETYFPGGIDLLLSFADAHIFSNPAFGFRNEEFYAKGGTIIAFRYCIQEGSMLWLRRRIGQLLGGLSSSL